MASERWIFLRKVKAEMFSPVTESTQKSLGAPRIYKELTFLKTESALVVNALTN